MMKMTMMNRAKLKTAKGNMTRNNMTRTHAKMMRNIRRMNMVIMTTKLRMRIKKERRRMNMVNDNKMLIGTTMATRNKLVITSRGHCDTNNT